MLYNVRNVRFTTGSIAATRYENTFQNDGPGSTKKLRNKTLIYITMPGLQCTDDCLHYSFGILMMSVSHRYLVSQLFNCSPANEFYITEFGNEISIDDDHYQFWS